MESYHGCHSFSRGLHLRDVFRSLILVFEVNVFLFIEDILDEPPAESPEPDMNSAAVHFQLHIVISLIVVVPSFFEPCLQAVISISEVA